MSGHTPGPWKADLADLHGFEDETRWSVFATREGRDFFVASIENGAPGDTLDTEAANARLIAAAPDLLEAAEAVLGCIGSSESTRPKKAALRAAIAKARGSE